MDYQKIAKKIRLEVLEMIYKSQSGHIGSSLSIVEILVALYFKILNLDPENPNNPERDRFILSKGHAVAALYAVLAEKGFFDRGLLKTYYQDGSKLPGHATRHSVPGIEASTGSLGHGLPMGNGLALAGKAAGKKYRIFVLMSDGECEEGSNWEAALFASQHKLDNLVAIIDRNEWQAYGRTDDVLRIEPLKKKWQDFGWEVKEADGHNFEEIFEALKEIPFQKGKPSLLIAWTVKGKGFSFSENKLSSHYEAPTKKEYEEILKREAS